VEGVGICISSVELILKNLSSDGKLIVAPMVNMGGQYAELADTVLLA